MKVRQGFTVVEMLIVIAIMAILFTIGAVSFRNYQANVRDKEREADISSIQTYLESIYPQEIRDGAGNILKPAGSYPAHVSGVSALTDADFETTFRHLQDDAKKGPAAQEVFLPAKRSIFNGHTANSLSDINAYKNDYAHKSATGHPNGAYVYFAHSADGSKCDGKNVECRRYVILYHTETKDTAKWQLAESRRK